MTEQDIRWYIQVSGLTVKDNAPDFYTITDLEVYSERPG